MSTISSLIQNIIARMSLVSFRFTDILEIIILAIVIYKIIVWIKDTKAWMLLRGIVFIIVFILVAAILQMDTILWLAQKLASIVAVAAVVVFQPEIRRALEKLGERGILKKGFSGSSRRIETSMAESNINALADACKEMGEAKTGALIVVERQIQLTEYEQTGIPMDSLISKQLVLNIFEHNTPLHDGAVIVRGNRIVAATCYLPLSNNNDMEKHFGTRHRAALGMSEVSDAFVIVVSEETGNISYAYEGKLIVNITAEELKEKLTDMLGWADEKRLFRLRKGKESNEEADE